MELATSKIMPSRPPIVFTKASTISKTSANPLNKLIKASSGTSSL
jgi:hypothetical protein